MVNKSLELFNPEYNVFVPLGFIEGIVFFFLFSCLVVPVS